MEILIKATKNKTFSRTLLTDKNDIPWFTWYEDQNKGFPYENIRWSARKPYRKIKFSNFQQRKLIKSSNSVGLRLPRSIYGHFLVIVFDVNQAYRLLWIVSRAAGLNLEHFSVVKVDDWPKYLKVLILHVLGYSSMSSPCFSLAKKNYIDSDIHEQKKILT